MHRPNPQMENSIKDARIVSDMTFAVRFKMFINSLLYSFAILFILFHQKEISPSLYVKILSSLPSVKSRNHSNAFEGIPANST